MFFFWTAVKATQIFIEGDENDISAHLDHFIKPIPRWVKEKFDDIRRTTGCILTLCEPQPELQRPKPFYYIQGTWEGVIKCQFLIQQMMCEYSAEKCEELLSREAIQQKNIWRRTAKDEENESLQSHTMGLVFLKHQTIKSNNTSTL